MIRSFVHRVIAMAAVAVAVLLCSGTAWAVPRYSSPTGTGDCSQLSPCGLETAVEGAAVGDEVIVAPGDYGSAGEPLASEITASGAIDVHGPPNGPRPRIFSFSDSVFAVGTGATLRDVEIRHTGASNALHLAGLAERVVVQSQAGACTLGAGAVLRNSVCWATQSQPAVRMAAAGNGQLPAMTGTLRNVTAYSRLGEGIRVTAGNFAPLTVLATNVIARGEFRDVLAEVLGSAGTTSADVALDHSNYDTRQQVGTGSVTAPGSGTNQMPPPWFVDDPLGDFHQLATSPTVNAGVTDAANGATDIDGQARVQEASTDIGADELPTRPPSPAPVAPRSIVDRTKPVASRFDVRPNAFAALRGRGASLIAAARKVRRGAAVAYRLSEHATVSFTIERLVRGRTRGTRCVARGRTGRRCFRYNRLRGAFQHPGRKGINRSRFSGRLNGKPLRSGRYRLVAVPRDAAGNRGKRVRAGFRIVRG